MKTSLLSALLTVGISQAAMAEPGMPLAEAIAQRGLSAGEGHTGLHSLCDLTMTMRVAGQRSAGADNRRHEHREERTPPEAMPTRVFDNLYFVGHRGVTSWAVTTDEGIVLIDAMNNDEEAKAFIEQGLIALGLDPNDITHLIITHAHGDHYGGQQYLVDNFTPRVLMAEADWAALEQEELSVSNPRWGEPPLRDITVADGDVLSLGDTDISMYVTPGHTAGTLSLIFPVHDGNDTHYVGLWGGTGFNFGPDEARLREYSASGARFRHLAEAANVDVFLSNHARRDNSIERIELLIQRASDEPHPFVTDDALGAFDLFSDCALAQAERLRAER
ncbi:MBL fold metallo-hydrolase [Halomonas sp. SIMBA_159]